MASLNATKTTSFTLPLVGAIAAALLVGCYPKAGPAPGAIAPSSVEWAAKKWPGETEAGLTTGRELFLAKCNGCHSYPDLLSVSEEDWPGDVRSMARKSDLPPEKGDLILHYVLTARNEQATAANAKPAASAP